MPTLPAVRLRKPTEFDEPGLVRMQFQSKSGQPVPKVQEKALCIAPVLEAAHESSNGGESHPSALSEPDVRLSPHPAPTFQPRVGCRAATGPEDWGPVASAGVAGSG